MIKCMAHGLLAVAAGVTLMTKEGNGRERCLTDAVIEAAVGDQIRAKLWSIDTSSLPQLPLCSGLSLGDQIQRMVNAAFPEEALRRQNEMAASQARAEAEEQQEEQQEELQVRVAHVKGLDQTNALRKTSSQTIRPFSSTAKHLPRRDLQRGRRKHATAAQTGRSYSSCRTARDAGAAPIYRGQPGYSRRLDRDGDGIACE